MREFLNDHEREEKELRIATGCVLGRNCGRVLDVRKKSDLITHHVCAGCGKAVSWWESTLEEKESVSEENLKKWV